MSAVFWTTPARPLRLSNGPMNGAARRFSICSMPRAPRARFSKIISKPYLIISDTSSVRMCRRPRDRVVMKTGFLACAVILLLTSGACGKENNRPFPTPRRPHLKMAPLLNRFPGRNDARRFQRISTSSVYRVKSPTGKIAIPDFLTTARPGRRGAGASGRSREGRE